MIVTGDPDELRALFEEARRRGKTVGLHAAMGALHGAHAANIAKMAAECDVASVVISRRSEDIDGGTCGRLLPAGDLEADLARADEAGAGIVFAPQGEAVRGDGPLVRGALSHLGGHLEAPSRPSHFDARLGAVAGLFGLAGPGYVYFGEKDYPRLLAVRRLVRALSLPVVVVACPTVRETDGLALSRQNAYLRPSERGAAPALYWALLAGKRAVDERGERDAKAVSAKMRSAVERQPLLELDYARVADPLTLEPVGTISGEVRLLIAGRPGRAHLVDNLAAGTTEE